MDDVVEDMQLIGLKQVDVDIKFLAIAGFCIIYGVCCITTNQNVLAKEITPKAIFLIKSLYGNEVNHIQILKICHNNLGVLCQRNHELKLADLEFAKAEKLENLIQPRLNPESSIDAAFMSVVPFQRFS